MQLFHGDCLDILPTLPDASVDAIITDPPYGTTACKWDSVIPFEPMWAELKRIIKPRGAIVLFASQPFTSALVISNPKWFKYQWVWEKTRATTFTMAKYRPLAAHEDIVVFGQGVHFYNPQMESGAPYRVSSKAGKHVAGTPVNSINKQSFIGSNNTGRYPRTVLRFSNPAVGTVHPTQKPVALLEYLVKTYTNEGETVLDFTFGSGTTGVACVNTSREFIGIERDATYYEIACKRITAAQTAPKQMECV